MAKVSLVDVCKVYQSRVKAVSDFNLEIKDGEFVVFVGPSGCGKSTTLRMIAGLEEITSGKVYIGDRLVNNLEPKDRDIAMVFQNYALYPHMSVFDNLAYSLKCHKEDKEKIKERVGEVAKLLGIEEYLERKPKELSGGQRQRVALGRCLIREPKVFLFDEPLSNLDAKLRVAMRSEISKLHEQVKGTFIYVTHDQIEAMTMGDRIVVMKDGYIQQVDSPLNLYEHPVNIFVATFLGSPQMNIFKGRLLEDKVVLGEGELEIPLNEKTKNKLIDGHLGEEVYLGIRPSDFSIAPKGKHHIHVEKVELVEKLGNETLVYFNMPGKKENALASLKLKITDDISGDLYLDVDLDRIHLFNMDEESILKANEVNYVQADFAYSKGELTIDGSYVHKDFGKHLINELPEGPFEGYIRVDSNHLSLEGDQDSIKIRAKVVAEDIDDEKRTYFAKKEKTLERITFYQSKDKPLKIGESVDLYVDVKDVSVYDSEMKCLSLIDEVKRPIIEAEICRINKDYYIQTPDKALAKNKHFLVGKVYDLKNASLLEGVNSKGESLVIKTDRNPDLFAGMLIYFAYKKKR